MSEEGRMEEGSTSLGGRELLIIQGQEIIHVADDEMSQESTGTHSYLEILSQTGSSAAIDVNMDSSAAMDIDKDSLTPKDVNVDFNEEDERVHHIMDSNDEDEMTGNIKSLLQIPDPYVSRMSPSEAYPQPSYIIRQLQETLARAIARTNPNRFDPNAVPDVTKIFQFPSVQDSVAESSLVVEAPQEFSTMDVNNTHPSAAVNVNKDSSSTIDVNEDSSAARDGNIDSSAVKDTNMDLNDGDEAGHCIMDSDDKENSANSMKLLLQITNPFVGCLTPSTAGPEQPYMMKQLQETLARAIARTNPNHIDPNPSSDDTIMDHASISGSSVASGVLQESTAMDVNTDSPAAIDVNRESSPARDINMDSSAAPLDVNMNLDNEDEEICHIMDSDDEDEMARCMKLLLQIPNPYVGGLSPALADSQQPYLIRQMLETLAQAIARTNPNVFGPNYVLEIAKTLQFPRVQDSGTGSSAALEEEASPKKKEEKKM